MGGLNNSGRSRGLPGLRGTEHVGFTVPNLDDAIAFFVDVLGCEPFYELGPYRFDDDWMSIHLNVPSRAVMRKLRFLRCGAGVNFEVIEYQVPNQRTEPPLNSDVGAAHLAFYVDDIWSAIAYLREKGVRILGQPTVRTGGQNGGQTWVYFLTPWGMQLELVSYPDGKGYELTTDRRLWHPADPSK
jgi:catechol 2,3-dioxygenase-like lactoylglutathione lyase family enzyme